MITTFLTKNLVEDGEHVLEKSRLNPTPSIEDYSAPDRVTTPEPRPIPQYPQPPQYRDVTRLPSVCGAVDAAFAGIYSNEKSPYQGLSQSISSQTSTVYHKTGE